VLRITSQHFDRSPALDTPTKKLIHPLWTHNKVCGIKWLEVTSYRSCRAGKKAAQCAGNNHWPSAVSISGTQSVREPRLTGTARTSRNRTTSCFSRIATTPEVGILAFSLDAVRRRNGACPSLLRALHRFAAFTRDRYSFR
jgi:hypothetical protein